MHPSIFLPLLRELSGTYQAFGVYSSAHMRSLGLTPAQFDIVVTLGNTPGMTTMQLSEKTLITKGTLTGVVGRTSGGLAANCGPGGGWFYDDPTAPASIRLCDDTCRLARDAVVEVEFGCNTVINVR